MLRNQIFSRVKPKTLFAQKLRKHPTPGEKVLWRKIRKGGLHRWKFRRQVPIGPYIVDFLCVEKKLILEVDGDTHYEQGAREHDQKREAYLREQGFDVLRIGNREAVQTLDEVLAKLGRKLDCPSD